MNKSDEELVDPQSDKPTTLRRVRQLTGKGEWSEVDKIRAVAIYLEVGVLTKVSEMTGVPVETLRNWKIAPWWTEVKGKIMNEHDEEISSRFTKIVKKAQKQVLDRIENGDWIVLKDGSSKRIPMKGKDAQYILNSAVDKRQLLNDRPTSRTESLTMSDKLKQLGAEFEKFSKAKQINQEKEKAVEVSETTRPE
jgi:hypothetical protein